MTDTQVAEGTKEPVSETFDEAWDALRDEGQKEAGQLPDGPETPEPAAEEKVTGQGDEPPLSSEAAPEAPAPAETPNDVWANAPPELREAHLREINQRDALIRSHSGRLSRADHELQELRKKLAPSSTGPAAGGEATGNERLTQLREQYPEIAEPILEQLAGLEAEVRELKGAKVNLDQERSEALLIEQERHLSERHPKWQEIASADAFRVWAQSQPRYVQEGIERNGVQIVDGAETADILDRYLAETQPKTSPAQERQQARRAEQLEGSRSTPTRTPAVQSGGGASDFDGAWDEFAAADRKREAASGRRR